MTDSTALNNLRTAHYGDWGLVLTSQDVHELWAEIETRDKRIAELESLVERLIEIGDWATIGMVISNSYSLTSEIRKLAEDRHDEWRMLVKGWKSSKQKEAYDLDEYKDNPEECER